MNNQAETLKIKTQGAQTQTPEEEYAIQELPLEQQEEVARIAHRTKAHPLLVQYSFYPNSIPVPTTTEECREHLTAFNHEMPPYQIAAQNLETIFKQQLDEAGDDIIRVSKIYQTIPESDIKNWGLVMKRWRELSAQTAQQIQQGEKRLTQELYDVLLLREQQQLAKEKAYLDAAELESFKEILAQKETIKEVQELYVSMRVGARHKLREEDIVQRKWFSLCKTIEDLLNIARHLSYGDDLRGEALYEIILLSRQSKTPDGIEYNLTLDQALTIYSLAIPHTETGNFAKKRVIKLCDEMIENKPTTTDLHILHMKIKYPFPEQAHQVLSALIGITDDQYEMEKLVEACGTNQILKLQALKKLKQIISLQTHEGEKSAPHTTSSSSTPESSDDAQK